MVYDLEVGGFAVLEGVIRGVFEVLLGSGAPSRRKSVFHYANFPFKKT